MPYSTVTWDITDPPNSQAANTAAQELRELRRDIKERLESYFTSIDANPLVAGGTGSSPLPFTMDWSESEQFVDGSIPSVAGYQTDTAGATSVTPAAISTIIIRRFSIFNLKGVTVAAISAWVYKAAGASISIDFRKQTRANPPVTSSIANAVSVTTGWHALSTGVIAEVIDPDTSYYFVVTLTSDGVNADSARLTNIKVS